MIAAAGNGQYAFPGNMPEVISAGGVFYTPTGEFILSDVASRFKSSVFPGREVPDVCGLVGNLPYGRLLLVPVPPKARLAKRPAFGMIAAGEPAALGDTARLKGWAMFSGTSAAAAMIAGAAAYSSRSVPNSIRIQSSASSSNPLPKSPARRAGSSMSNRHSAFSMSCHKIRSPMESIRQIAKQAAAADPAHDFSHSERVLANALKIAAEEGGDTDILTAAAFLHDIANLPKNHPQSHLELRKVSRTS